MKQLSGFRLGIEFDDVDRRVGRPALVGPHRARGRRGGGGGGGQRRLRLWRHQVGACTLKSNFMFLSITLSMVYKGLRGNFDIVPL